MIKRLIFDLDNTLIKWIPEYASAIIETLKEFNLDLDYKKIDEANSIMEKKYPHLTKEDLLYEINNICNSNLKIEFIDRLLENQKKLAPTDDYETINTLEYLSDKYELVLLTNWFTDCQVGRLETLGVKKYFKEFYGSDIVETKPNPNSYKMAAGDKKMEECIMIGDNLKTDIEGALSVGMGVIKCDLYNLDLEVHEYPVIKKISDLKEML